MPAALIQKLEHWTRLSDRGKRNLNELEAATFHVRKGEDPMRDVDRSRQIAVISHGWAVEHRTMRDGHRVIVSLMLPGDFDAMPGAGPVTSSLSYTMLSDGRVIAFDRDKLEAVCEDPSIRGAMRWAEMVREATLREWLVNIGARRARERLAHLFCEIHIRTNNIGLARDGRCPMPLTQADLADALSMTNVHLNKALQQLRRAGLVALGSRELVILDWPGLVRLATFDETYLHRWPTAHTDRRQRAMPPPAGRERRGYHGYRDEAAMPD